MLYLLTTRPMRIAAAVAQVTLFAVWSVHAIAESEPEFILAAMGWIVAFFCNMEALSKTSE